jgi:NAD(P)-dependent dehydrogenase (short-subunit alcohol dehydrogenase family)
MGIVLVTGGSRGIGASVALRCAERGDDVAITYLTQRQSAEDIVTKCERFGVRAIALPVDLAVESEIVAAFTTVDEGLGLITGLVNNAGILETQSRLDQISADRIARVFAVNVTGAFVCAREAVLRMSTMHGGDGGAIVNVSSAASRTGSPNEYIDYAASKGAIDTMTLGLAKEVGGEGIRVNAVRPGLIDTQMHADGGEPGRVQRLASTIPLQRGGTSEEVAALVDWLLSDESSYVSGALIDVNGGR